MLHNNRQSNRYIATSATRVLSLSLLLQLFVGHLPLPEVSSFLIPPSRRRFLSKRLITIPSQEQQQQYTPFQSSQSLPPSKSSLSLSPSGIDEWSTAAQAGVFVATYAGLASGTLIGTNLLDQASKSFGLERWRANVIDTTLPFLFGLFFASAGVGHFGAADSFRDIYPPPGTWGFWYLPGSATFHVAWTGIAEFLGGLGLLFGGVKNILLAGDGDDDDDGESASLWNLIQPASALGLFVLTLVVTPANIYMFTHGATMGEAMGPLAVSFHAIRFAVQIVVLSLLLALAKDSFFFAWGDELD